MGDATGFFVRVPGSPELAAALAHVYALGAELVSRSAELLDGLEAAVVAAKRSRRRR
jgi:hypothetical protein